MVRRCIAWCLTLLLATGLVVLGSPCVDAALQKPTYAIGDRWVYDLEGSLDAFPGMNASDIGNFSFGLVGRVTVSILGPGEAVVDGKAIPAIAVETRATGALNGTFTAPGFPAPGTVGGTFSSLATEFWETDAYLPVASNGTTTYAGTITLFIAVDFSTSIRLNATTAYASIPAFELDVGETASAPYIADVLANATTMFFGETFTSENATTFGATWSREVLRMTTVTVDAGTFPAYEMNQSLTAFPGLAGLGPSGGNETAYYSNSTGNYVRREAYANGTKVAEMTLRSYAYGARSSGLSIVDLSLLIGVPIAALLAVLIWARRRKKRTPGKGEADPRAR